ncbi:MAG: hypothetical protein Q7U76_12865 [Nitrospirota bacterium]|nr:hypothetical protein [Nitrospirota bacterium]
MKPIHYHECLSRLGESSSIFGPKPCCCTMIRASREGWAKAGRENKKQRALQFASCTYPTLHSIQQHVDARARARQAKQWSEADQHTRWLMDHSVTLYDRPHQPTQWRWALRYHGQSASMLATAS